jgi:NAD(P)-dependent dehydrogenase (short-subunit alcohol dehydrogenase family)
MFQLLSGKKVVIIGTSSGIDLAIAKKMVEMGAKVVLSHSSQEKLNEAMALVSLGIDGKTVDLLNEDAVNGFFEHIGNFDHLILYLKNLIFLNMYIIKIMIYMMNIMINIMIQNIILSVVLR